MGDSPAMSRQQSTLGVFIFMGKFKDLTGTKWGKLSVVKLDRVEKHQAIWECKYDCGNTTYSRVAYLINGHKKSCGKCSQRDISGQSFNEWTAIRYAGENKNGKKMWECRCSCGAVKKVQMGTLVSGRTNSCGHLRKYKNDISGVRFGQLTAIKRAGCNKYHNTMWECLCDCGRMSTVSYSSLVKKNGTRSCRNGIHHSKNIIGNKYRKLTVLSLAGTHDKEAWWNCKCDCGGEIEASTGDLIGGNVNSCGCLKYRNKHNLAGMRFGYLTAIRDSGERKHRVVVWICRCDCGNEVKVVSVCLLNGTTKSCGCRSSELKAKAHITHGKCYTKEYVRMKARERKELELSLDTEWTTDMEIALSNYFPACVVCGGTKKMSTDHVLPLSKRNPLKPGNAIRLCGSCNSIKGPRNLDQIPEYMVNPIISAAKKFKDYWELSFTDNQI